MKKQVNNTETAILFFINQAYICAQYIGQSQLLI
jgi:hypothetical protein